MPSEADPEKTLFQYKDIDLDKKSSVRDNRNVYNKNMLDVHCHLQFDEYEKDRENVINEAKKIGIDQIFNASTTLKNSKKAVELAEKYKNLYAIIGIHPNHAHEQEKGWDLELKKIAKSSKKVIGIGEIGLDYFKHSSNEIINKNKQEQIFRLQIEIAIELDLPLQIHNRQAGEDIVRILKEYKNSLRVIPGMFHCMSGNVSLIKNVLELGFYVGFDGNITYKGIAKGEDTPLSILIEESPIERIVTETDSPLLAPIPFRGSRNEPKNVIIVVEKIAEIKGLKKEIVAEETTKNAKKIFNIDFS